MSVKANINEKYDDIMCRVCKKEEESQRHILICEKLNEGIIISNDEYYMNGSIEEMVLVATKFNENMKN